MVESLGDGPLHGSAQDAAGLPGQSLGSQPQQFHPGVGQQSMRTAGGVERMLDQLGEALPLDDGFEVNPDLEAAGQGGIGRAVQGVRQCRVSDQPDGHQVAGVEGKVQEGREVLEELGREVLGFVDNPEGQQVLAIDPIQDTGLEVAPQLGAAVGGLDPEGEGQRPLTVFPVTAGNPNPGPNPGLSPPATRDTVGPPIRYPSS